MAEGPKSPTEDIRKRLSLLSFLTGFILTIFLFIILRYVPGPLSEYLKFLPDTSIYLITIITIFLAGIGYYLSWVLSKQVIRKIEDYRHRLEKLLSVTQDIREEIYGDILLNKIMDSALAITHSDAGSILIDEEDGLAFKVVKGQKASELLGKVISKEKGIGAWVLKTGEPALIEDVSKDPHYNTHVDEMTGYKTRSMLCVPLKTNSATIGVIEIINTEKGRYDNKDLQMISYLADHAAISIERAKFYEDHRNYEIHLTDILLDTIDRFIPEKQGHSKRVAGYANSIARALGMPEEKRRRLYFASLLHDIGFLRLPLDRSFEKEIFMTHPVIGYEILKPITLYKDIAPYVLHHHERYDGYGYPDRLKGENIPLESRIIAVAEAYDSMVSKVSYRIAITEEAALEELLKNKGGQFDPMVVDAFAKELIKG